MVMLMIMFWWLYARWAGTEAWSWAVIAGVVGGLAIYVKFVAAFFVIGAALGLGFSRFGRDLLRKRQVWLMAALGALPAAAYLYYGIVQHDFLRGQFSGRFIPALLLNPINYLHWAEMANLAAGALAVAAGTARALDRQPEEPPRTAHWALGCLPGLRSVLRLSRGHARLLSPAADCHHSALHGAACRSCVGAASHAGITRSWSQWVLVASFLYVVFSGAWQARSQLAAVDYRPQAAMWAEIGDLLGHGPNVVALTQDYGSRWPYWGWQNAIIWPSTGDDEYRQARGGQIDFDERFNRLTLGNTYFLVTDFDELGRQPDLERRLSQIHCIRDEEMGMSSMIWRRRKADDAAGSPPDPGYGRSSHGNDMGWPAAGAAAGRRLHQRASECAPSAGRLQGEGRELVHLHLR